MDWSKDFMRLSSPCRMGWRSEVVKPVWGTAFVNSDTRVLLCSERIKGPSQQWKGFWDVRDFASLQEIKFYW